MAQPTGTVTLLFTDVEGSTRLLERLGTERYAEALEAHRRLLREAFFRHGGYEVDTEGDAFFVAFSGAKDAVAAACEAELALSGEEWPDGVEVRVRMGIHTGEPLPVGAKYVGMDVHRAARVMSAAHGGQVLVSETTAGLLDGVPLRDLGPQRLKDLLEPIRLYQLEIDGLADEFPPLKSLHRTNLPVAAWPLLGREDELDEMRRLLDDGVRLVTLTGPGGSGKTRLALEAAADLSDEYPGGTFFVALAPLRDLSAVVGTVAEAVGLQPDDDVAGWLAARRVLLVLDNLEHLPGVDAVVAQLLVEETTVVATSRAPLRLAVERELPVEPLPDDAAVELFVSRAAAAGRRVEADETVAEVCRRLDNLPLALELAAARSKLLSPSALLQRLDAALPLLTGGASDRPHRQQTLRATIEWSHDLLDSETQAAFRRLSVFRGSFTLDAAEAITGADLDQIAAMLDQSLLKPLGDDRFFQLETIREYARERLDEAGETAEYGLRHARWYLARLESDESDIWGERRNELFAWFVDEEDNLRAMLDRLAGEAIVEAARAAHLLRMYWTGRSAWAEERLRMGELLAHEDLSNDARAKLLLGLVEVELRVGNTEAMEAAAHDVVQLAEPGTFEHVQSLMVLGLAAAQTGRSDDAVRFAREALEELDSFTDSFTELRRVILRGDIANVLSEAGHLDEARELYRETRDECHRIGDDWGVVICDSSLAQCDLHQHRYEAARAGFASVLDSGRRFSHFFLENEVLRDLGLALVGLGRCDEARAAFRESLDIATKDDPTAGTPLFDALNGIALAARDEDASYAARLRCAVQTLRNTTKVTSPRRMDELEHLFEQPLIDAIGQEVWEREQAIGATMALDETIELARSLTTLAGGPS